MRSPRPAARIIALMQCRNGRAYSISTNTCRIPGKPLKRRGAYAIVTAFNSAAARARRKPPIDHRVLARPWLGAANVRPRALSRSDEPPLGSAAATCDADAKTAPRTTNDRDHAPSSVGRQRRRRSRVLGRGRDQVRARARSRRESATLDATTATSTSLGRVKSTAPTSWSSARTRTTTRSARRSASRAPASTCRNARRAARRSRSRSRATAACRSRACCSRPARRRTSRGSSARASIELDVNGGVGTARGVKLDFKGVPILYAPYFSFPINDERKSGFLTPDISSRDRTGFDLAVPYYLNLAPNYDLTLEPRYMSKRGTQVRSDFRYLLPNSRGEFGFEYLPDDDETQHDAPLRQSAARVAVRRARSAGGAGRDSRKSRTTPTSRTSAAASRVTSQTHLNRFVDLTFFAPNWSLLTRLQNYQTIDPVLTDDRASVRARAADGVRRPLARPALDVRLEHRARELRSQRRHDGLAARLDAGGQPALRARRHVPDAGHRAAPDELLARQSGAGRRRHADARLADRQPRHGPDVRARHGRRPPRVGADARAAPACTCTCRSRTRATCRSSTRSCRTST